MSRRSRPQYRPGLAWILGVAFPDTLTRPDRLAQGFTFVRCCGSPRASSPHGLTAPAPASHDGEYCVQLPPARGCYRLALATEAVLPSTLEARGLISLACVALSSRASCASCLPSFGRPQVFKKGM